LCGTLIGADRVIHLQQAPSKIRVLMFSSSQRRNRGTYSNGLGIHPTVQDASNVKPQPTSPTAGACLFEALAGAGQNLVRPNLSQGVANSQPTGASIRLIYFSHMLRP
jgi:hypothetical protein